MDTSFELNLSSFDCLCNPHVLTEVATFSLSSRIFQLNDVSLYLVVHICVCQYDELMYTVPLSSSDLIYIFQLLY